MQEYLLWNDTLFDNEKTCISSYLLKTECLIVYLHMQWVWLIILSNKTGKEKINVAWNNHVKLYTLIIKKINSMTRKHKVISHFKLYF